MLQKNSFDARILGFGALIFLVGCVTKTPPPAENTPGKPRSGLVHPAANETAADSLAALSKPPALDDLLRLAALRNPALEAAFYDWKAALEEVPQARALPDPKFTYGYFVEQVETRVGPQRQRFGVAQTFPWFGTLRLRESRAGQRAIAAEQRYQQAKLALFYRVKELFFELAYLRQAIRLTEENIGLLKHLESVAQAKLRSGGEAASVVKAQVELGKLEDRLLTLVDLRRPLNAQLNEALNRDVGAPIPWPAEVTSTAAVWDSQDIVEHVLITSPDLKELAAFAQGAAHSEH